MSSFFYRDKPRVLIKISQDYGLPTMNYLKNMARVLRKLVFKVCFYILYVIHATSEKLTSSDVEKNM